MKKFYYICDFCKKELSDDAPAYELSFSITRQLSPREIFDRKREHICGEITLGEANPEIGRRFEICRDCAKKAMVYLCDVKKVGAPNE